MSACAQCFILELPPKIAAIWFPASEIATATSLGVFGNQLGVALGFLIPPKIIKGPRTAFIGSNKWINGKETNQTYQGKTYPNYEWTDTSKYNETVVENAIQEVRGQINILYWGFAAITAVLFILVFLVFKDKPARPANRASIKRLALIDQIWTALTLVQVRYDGSDTIRRAILHWCLYQINLKSCQRYSIPIISSIIWSQCRGLLCNFNFIKSNHQTDLL